MASKTIAIFGGSFDPIHKGHIMVAKAIVKNKLADTVWFMPSYLTPGKEKQISKWEDRIKMLKLAVGDAKWAKISDFEIKEKCVSYTYLTIGKLKEKYPKQDFSLVMGSDSFKSFPTWENSDEIAQSVNIIVYPREGYEISKSSLKKYGATLLDLRTKNVSSTNIRKGNPNNLHDSTIEYVCKHNLYARYLDDVNMSDARKKHSLEVAREAYEIGKTISLKMAYRAYFAGMLHDIAKEQKGSTPITHGALGAKYCANVLGIEDKQILSAISKHTMGATSMSKLDKIIYIADVSSRYQKHIGELARKDLDKAFIEMVKNKKSCLEKEGVTPDKVQVKTWNKWIKK